MAVWTESKEFKCKPFQHKNQDGWMVEVCDLLNMQILHPYMSECIVFLINTSSCTQKVPVAPIVFVREVGMISNPRIIALPPGFNFCYKLEVLADPDMNCGRLRS